MAISDDILDETVKHSVYLERYKRSVIRDILKLLRQTEDGVIKSVVRKELQDMKPRELQRLYLTLRKEIDRGYTQIFKLLQDEIDELAKYEGQWQMDLFANTVPINIDFTTAADEQLIAAVMARPFAGKILREWWRDVPEQTFSLVRNTIRQGYIDGQSTPEIIRALRGTRTTPALLNNSRRSIEAVVRTSLAHTANVARNVVYEKNKRVIKGYEWVATLDSRTSAVCRARDGKIYRKGRGPLPPAHPNCRSTTIPVIKSLKEMGLDTKDLPQETRASMNGQVSAELNYDQWLRKQPRAFQDEVLGKSKAQLFRAGVTMERFVDRQGNELNLAQLKQRESAAWAKAGL